MNESNEQEMLFPASHPVPGCLPRASKPGARCPMFGESIKVIPASDWDAAAKEIGDGIRQKIKFCLDQGQVGSCACESSTGSLMAARNIAGMEHVLLNPYAMYHFTSGGRDSGSSIDDDLEFARDYGVPPESVWPRSNGWRTKPSDAAMEEAKKHRIEEFFDITTKEEFVTALLLGFPVVWGANGHAVLGVAHCGSYPLILNSWGTGWGDQGYGKWASYNAIVWAYGAFAVRVATSNQG